MSGGVDSRGGAPRGQGYDVVGATMKLTCHGDELPDRPCCSLDSVNDARRVCDQLGIPHYVLNLEKAFGRDVVDDFVHEYANGRTPIPCVRCNTFTKFRDLVAKADAIDVAGCHGHYAASRGPTTSRPRSRQRPVYVLGFASRVLARLRLPGGRPRPKRDSARQPRVGLSPTRPRSDICLVTRHHVAK